MQVTMTSAPPADGDAGAAALAVLRALADAARDPQAADLAWMDAGGGPAGDWWAEARRLAHGIRDTLVTAERQSHQLTALYDTVTELSSSLDTETVLRSIVRRARTLTGADAAYLTLNDDAMGDTYMRSVDGISTRQFAELRLSYGTGLGGLVAQYGRAEWTDDYLGDNRFEHVQYMDDAVALEGLRAVIGVPLVRHGTVIGVLMAANRDGRGFNGAHAALLASFSGHATIALVNANLYAQAERADAQHATALAELQARTGAIEQAATLHEQLTALLVEGADANRVASAVAGVLGGHLAVLDQDSDLLARSSVAAGDGIPDPVLESARAMLPGVRATRRTERPDARTAIVPIGTRDEWLGALVYAGTEVGASTLRMLERAAMVIAVLLLNDRIRDETERRLGGELISDLLAAGQRDLQAIRRRSRALNVDVSGPLRLLVVDVPAPVRRAALTELAGLARAACGTASEHASVLVALAPAAVAGSLVTTLRTRLRRHGPAEVSTAISDVVAGIEDLPRAFEETRRLLELSVTLSGPGGHVDARRPSLLALLLTHDRSADLRRIAAQTLAPVIQHDRRRRTDLMSTLATYLATQGNATRAAERLTIHVNTLYQRLEKIDQLLPADWREGDSRLQIHLAIRIWRAGA